MGSISGLKSNLLLVRPVHLRHDGSKQPEHNDFTLNKNALNEYNSYRTQSTSCMALLLGIRQ